jgi:hypothetical protein
MTHVTAQTAEAIIQEGVHAQPVRRIGAGTFWSLIIVELIILFGVLIWALGWLTPAQTPYASTHDLVPVQEAIYARLSGATLDPLVQVAPGVSARSSSLRGFALNDRTYYYYVVGEENFDPLSLGRVTEQQVEILLRDESGPQTLVVYTIKSS